VDKNSWKFNVFGKKWFRAIALTGLAVYIYVFMEWVFFATKPSFMSSMNAAQKLMVLFVASFILTLTAFLLAGVTILIARLQGPLHWLVALIPAVIFTLLALILFDNFTYTVFKFGIVTSQGVWRAIYAAGFLVTFFYFLKKFSVSLQHPPDRAAVLFGYLVVFLAAVSSAAFISRVPHFHFTTNNLSKRASSGMPNIILLGFDGVNATHMSLYGYQRETTPHLTELSQNALIAENAFSNVGKTGGSLTSLLTGKLPTETRVIFPPDVLLGEDAYQHLPGILKQLGYTTVQITMPYYGDAYERNVQEGFEIVNSRSVNMNPLASEFARMGGDSSFYFSGLIIQRISERLKHIFFIQKMENPYKAVTEPVSDIHDDQRLAEMIDYLDKAKGPLFLHVHMMDTHGRKFYVPNQHFSAGETQDEEWMTDFYDDSILNSDRYINDLFNYLSKSGKIKNTIVILYSDHGMNWNPLERVPLIFWFPNGQYAGNIQENVQLIDVAPTILDYLDVLQPAWMQGRSILTDNLSPTREILSANVGNELLFIADEQTWIVDKTKISPPFYQLGTVNLIVCNQWFSLDLRKPELSYGTVEGSTASCPADAIPSPQEAEAILVQHLSNERYDVATLSNGIPVTGGR
jgi:arylsulfatase A-like enzyme